MQIYITIIIEKF